MPSVNLSGMAPPVVATVQQHVRAVEANPRSGEAWGWLGALLWTYDFRTEALQCLAHAERLQPANPRWPYLHGMALLVLAPGKALPRLARAAELCGNDPEAPRFRLAALLAEHGRWPEAVTELDRLLQAKPDFAPARLLRARAAAVQGDRVKAVELARRCTSDPRTARPAWALLGLFARQEGNLSAAEDASRRSQAAPPEEGIADPFQAEVMLRRGDARALSEQAHPLLAAGRLTEAAALIDRLGREHRSFPDTWLLMGRLQYLRKEYGPAEQSLRRFLELNPQSTQGLFQLGSTLLAQGRFSEAAGCFQSATQLKPDFGPAYFNEGFALARGGQKREAVAAFQKSLRYNPEHLQSYVLLADLHLQAGEIESALELIARAEALSPANPRVQALRDQAARARSP